jgi:hypothetical protein
MGLLLCICLAVPCAIVIRRRRRSAVPYVLPLAALALLLIAGAWSARALPYEIAILAHAHPLDPSMKATLLAKGISELMNCAAFVIVVVLPLAIGGYFVDRWLLARWKSHLR